MFAILPGILTLEIDPHIQTLYDDDRGSLP